MAIPARCTRHHTNLTSCPDCMARLAHEREEARRRLEAGGLG